jgi:hypothetical protein
LSSYDWPGCDRGPVESTCIILTITLVYMLIGLFFAWLAKRRFRRNIF